MNSIDDDLTSSYICLAELYEGVHRTKNKNQEESLILDFFSNLNNIFTINHEIAKKFGEIRTHLKSRGEFIGDIDILIAATCITNNQILITDNKKHFSRVPNLKIF